MRPDMAVPKGIFFGHLLDPFPHDDLVFFKTIKDSPSKRLPLKEPLKLSQKPLFQGLLGSM
jgi:hypothetical protein